MNRWSTVPRIYLFISVFNFIVSQSIDSTHFDVLNRKVYNFSTLNEFYRKILENIQKHRSIDTVLLPINVTKILLNEYDENYLKTSCYESMSDILYAHGYNRTEISNDEFQSILPSIVNGIMNNACIAQSPPKKIYSTWNVSFIGLCLIFLIKLTHLITFSFVGDYGLSLTSVNLTRAFSNPIRGEENDPSTIWRSRLWFSLAFNAFTCGLMLGTAVYHIIPNIFDIPNEDFDYVYLLRATVIFSGIYLFFIVEKLLRFRFNIDEFQFEEATTNDKTEPRKESDSTMIQMARMCGTLHISTEMIDHSRRCASSPLKLQQVESDDEDFDVDLSNDMVFKPNKSISIHEQNKRQENLTSKRRLIIYHIFNDFSNDLIYGCALASGFFHDRMIGGVLALILFSEGFRRHSQMICQLGRKRAIFFLILSFIFLVIGFGICIYLVDLDRRDVIHLNFIHHEYVYSVLSGSLIYTALVTLIPELNDFGQHLQTSLRQTNQTTKQRRLMKTLIIISQNLFLLIGVITSLVFACIFRYYHRHEIFEFVCKRDHFRSFCSHP